ncbi:MAG: N-acetyltransferase [Candidatus Hydrogenedentota bacterium]
MKEKVPCKVSQEKIEFDVSELEALFQLPPLAQKPYPPAFITLKGKNMVIREAREDEFPLLIEMMQKLVASEQFKEGKDFYDIVGIRVYAELLGVIRKRLKDPYTFVGLIDGKLAGFCNGRLWNEDINISLHTMAFARGMRAGATMYYAKAEYCFDILGQKEFWATYESYNGFKRWAIQMAQPSKPYPEYQHELGGAKVFYMTKDYWDKRVKKYLRDLVGAEFQRPVPPELLKANEKFTLPEEIEI